MNGWPTWGLSSEYNQNIIDHSKKEYVNLNDNTQHTNNIEGAWRILKSAVKGNYLCVLPKHLQLYIDEFVFRFNMKHETGNTKFNHLINIQE